MKIAFVSYSFSKGGASKANCALMNELRALGLDVDPIDAKFLIRQSPLRAFFIMLPHTILYVFFKYICPNHKISFHLKGLMSGFAFDDYDVMLLGWVGNGMIDYETVQKFRGKVFARLSDQFLLNELGFHFYYGEVSDFTRSLLKLINAKRYLKFRKIPISFLCPSEWIFDQVKDFEAGNAILFRNSKSGLVQHIEKLVADDTCNDPTIAIFVCDNFADLRKGGTRLAADLAWMAAELKISRLILVGSGSTKYSQYLTAKLLLEVHEFVPQDRLAYLYKRSGFIFVPSLLDNSPNTLIEGIAAGCIPVIYPDSGGTEEYCALSPYYLVRDENSSLVTVFPKKFNNGARTSEVFI